MALRAGGAQLRPLHLLLHPLPAPRDRSHLKSSGLVIGLGNRYRGDDAAGLEAARLIAERDPGVEVIVHEREPSDLLDLWRGRARVIAIDSVAGAEPGRVHRFDAAAAPLPAVFEAPASSHALGLAEVIELGRSLGRLPDGLEVIGIEGTSFQTGAELTPAVAGAAAEVAGLVLGSLAPER